MLDLAHDQSYFEWMRRKVYDDEHPISYSYEQLLSYLFSKPYQWTLQLDANRAADGLSLRYQYAFERHIPYSEVSNESPCSTFEMLVALAMKCESIMSNSEHGDRTGLWFWLMIGNLDFSSMPDNCFDTGYANYILNRFFSNQYLPDGNGGLFCIPGIDEDLRHVDIYTQMYWFLDFMFPEETNFSF